MADAGDGAKGFLQAVGGAVTASPRRVVGSGVTAEWCCETAADLPHEWRESTKVRAATKQTTARGQLRQIIG